METKKHLSKTKWGGVLLVVVILTLNILMPIKAFAAPEHPAMIKITIDGTSEFFDLHSDNTWKSSIEKWDNPSFTIDSDGYIVYNEKHLKLDGSSEIVRATDTLDDGYSYTTVPIPQKETKSIPMLLTVQLAPLDFTVTENVSMRATQGNTVLTVDPIIATNTGNDTLKVTSIEITAGSGWTVANSSTDFTTASKNTLGFTCNSHDFSGGAYTPADKLTTESNAKTYNILGKISANADVTTSTQVASIVVTVEKVNIISFTIDKSLAGGSSSESYQAEEGMTWEEWINSSYNTDGYIEYEHFIRYDFSYDSFSIVNTSTTDKIRAGGAYELAYHEHTGGTN